MRKSTLWVIFLILSLCDSASAMEIICPPTIRVHEALVTSPAGWTGDGIKERDHMFNYMSFGTVNFKHKPEFPNAPFREDDEKQEAGITTLIWKVDGSNVRNLADGYAVFCTYHSTDMIIIKPLPGSVKICTVRLKENKWKRYDFLDAHCD